MEQENEKRIASLFINLNKTLINAEVINGISEYVKAEKGSVEYEKIVAFVENRGNKSIEDIKREWRNHAVNFDDDIN